MDIDLASAALTARQSATLEVARMKMLKNEHDMQMSLIDMLAKTVKSAPPPGQGTYVDKTA